MNIKNRMIGLTAGLAGLILSVATCAGPQVRTISSPTQEFTVQELIRQELIGIKSEERDVTKLAELVKPDGLDQDIARLVDLVKSDSRTKKIEHCKGRHYTGSYSSVSLGERGNDRVDYRTIAIRTPQTRVCDEYTLEFTEQGPRPAYVVEHSIRYSDFGDEGPTKEDALWITQDIMWTGNKCHGKVGAGSFIQDEGLSFRGAGRFLWDYAHFNERGGYYDIFVDLPVKSYPAVIRAYVAKLKLNRKA